jgi:hypothetical protein
MRKIFKLFKRKKETEKTIDDARSDHTHPYQKTKSGFWQKVLDFIHSFFFKKETETKTKEKGIEINPIDHEQTK